MTVILDKSAIKGIEQKAYSCLGKTAKTLQDEIREEMVIPRAEGNLQGEAFHVDTSTEQKGYVRMSFNAPYARRLYYHPEYKFHKSPWTDSKGNSYEGNPNAQGLWLRHWQKKGKHAKRPKEIFEGLLKMKL